MKDETKQKLKKAAKVCGLFAGFLATFILGMGFGSCSEKKLQDQSSQRQSQPKTLAPKMVLDPAKNLLQYAELYESRAVVDYGGIDNNYVYASAPSYNTYVVNRSYMPSGHAYVLSYEGNGAGFYEFEHGHWVLGIANAVYQKVQNGQDFLQFSDSLRKRVDFLTSALSSPLVMNLPSGFYVTDQQGSSNILNVSICVPVTLTGIYLVEESFYLNNAEGVPLTFGENWLPYGIFTQWASGNLGIAINNFGDAQTTQNTLLRAAFSDLLFTCGDGFGYDGIEIVARPLWNGAKYINSSGEVLTYSWSVNNEYVPLVINYVNYRRFDNHAWVRVADYSLRINNDGTAIAINPQLTWQADIYKSPRFFRYPSGFVYPSWSISSDVGANWGLWQPSRPQAGLTFFDWFSLRAEDIAIGNLIGMDGGNIFTLISSGFTAVLPIFNVQVLPFLTIGTLLFAPLVILLIFAILKVLNK